MRPFRGIKAREDGHVARHDLRQIEHDGQMLAIEAECDAQQDRHGRGDPRRRQPMPGEGREGRAGGADDDPDRDADGGGFPSQACVVELQADERPFECAQAAGERNENQAAPEQPGCAEYREAAVTTERAGGMCDNIRGQGCAKRVHAPDDSPGIAAGGGLRRTGPNTGRRTIMGAWTEYSNRKSWTARRKRRPMRAPTFLTQTRPTCAMW